MVSLLLLAYGCYGVFAAALPPANLESLQHEPRIVARSDASSDLHTAFRIPKTGHAVVTHDLLQNKASPLSSTTVNTDSELASAVNAAAESGTLVIPKAIIHGGPPAAVASVAAGKLRREDGIDVAAAFTDDGTDGATTFIEASGEPVAVAPLIDAEFEPVAAATFTAAGVETISAASATDAGDASTTASQHTTDETPTASTETAVEPDAANDGSNNVEGVVAARFTALPGSVGPIGPEE